MSINKLGLCKVEKETGSDRWPEKQAYLVAASVISALSKRAREKRLPTFPDEVDFLRRWIGSAKPRAAKQSSRVFGQRIATSSTNDPSRSWFLRLTSDMDISCPDYSVYSLKISWPRKWSDLSNRLTDWFFYFGFGVCSMWTFET